MRIAILPFLALFGACNDKGSDDSDDINYGPDDPDGIDVPIDAATVSHEHNLSEGSSIDLAFAEQIYCFPATENANFNGNHVFIEHTQQDNENVTIVVNPEKGVDVSLYVIQMDVDSTDLPPNITGGGGVSCESAYDQVADSNAGEPEGLVMTAWTDSYRLIIGVAGANNLESGAFKVDIWDGEP